VISLSEENRSSLFLPKGPFSPFLYFLFLVPHFFSLSFSPDKDGRVIAFFSYKTQQFALTGKMKEEIALLFFFLFFFIQCTENSIFFFLFSFGLLHIRPNTKDKIRCYSRFVFYERGGEKKREKERQRRKQDCKEWERKITFS